jgi:hypothetical protein
MAYVYHIVAIHVNETSRAHVWRLRFLYLGTGYDSILYLILSIGMPLYQEGCYIDCQQSPMLNERLNTQVR